MDNWKIAICDDEKVHREQAETVLHEYALEKGINLTIMAYESGIELLEQIEHDSFEMFILDVDMPSISGVELARKIREISKTSVVCFVTSYENYAYEAFGVEAVDYVVKPMQMYNLEKVMKKAELWYKVHKEQEEAEKRFIEVHISGEPHNIDTNNLWYIEKRRNQCVLHMSDYVIECYDTLSGIYDKLNQTAFCYCHQGYIINFYKIKEIRGSDAYLSQEICVPISRKYLSSLKKRFNNKLEQMRIQG